VEIIKKIDDLNKVKRTKPLALIPTMGNLHQGHLSLLKKAKTLNLMTLVTIFVNPLQFGPKEDLETYPRSLDQDMQKLVEEGCHYLFLPKKKELLEDIKYLKAPLSDQLCGQNRPGHFDGVVTIVHRFLELIKPEFCLFGQKDFQQQLIIKNHLENENLPTKLILGPTVRDKNGLALSSRNNYLTKKEQEEAALIFKCLKIISETITKNKSYRREDFLIKNLEVCKELENQLQKKGFEIDYLEIVNAKTLKKMTVSDHEILIAIAANYKGVRLIDNIYLELPLS
tara:strand:- start:919 stop:1770 length:852 start_codon:yes stop_codon:yes gene_type:complete